MVNNMLLLPQEHGMNCSKIKLSQSVLHNLEQVSDLIMVTACINM